MNLPGRALLLLVIIYLAFLSLGLPDGSFGAAWPMKYPDLAYQFRIVDGERHAGMQLESYTRGTRFVFAPLAPEQGPGNFP